MTRLRSGRHGRAQNDGIADNSRRIVPTAVSIAVTINNCIRNNLESAKKVSQHFFKRVITHKSLKYVIFNLSDPIYRRLKTGILYG
jgi:hypothetical protein